MCDGRGCVTEEGGKGYCDGLVRDGWGVMGWGGICGGRVMDGIL